VSQFKSRLHTLEVIELTIYHRTIRKKAATIIKYALNWNNEEHREMKLFELGKITMTPSAISIIAGFKVAVGDLLDRHEKGDYGDVSEVDWRENTFALLPESIERIMSVYTIRDKKLWVITDPDRKVTTLLTEEDF
jgi:hypothetical protein